MNSHELAFFVVKKTIDHLELSVISVLLAILFVIPIGMYLIKSKKKTKDKDLILKLISIVLAIPSLALMGLIIASVILLQSIIRFAITDVFLGVIVLVFYAFLPILNGVITGVNRMDSKITKSWQEIKPAIFFFVKGIRTSIVLTVSMATLVALIGSGGLGDLIVEGFKKKQADLILLGAVPAAFLGITLDQFMNFIQNRLKKNN